MGCLCWPQFRNNLHFRTLPLHCIALQSCAASSPTSRNLLFAIHLAADAVVVVVVVVFVAMAMTARFAGRFLRYSTPLAQQPWQRSFSAAVPQEPQQPQQPSHQFSRTYLHFVAWFSRFLTWLFRIAQFSSYGVESFCYRLSLI